MSLEGRAPTLELAESPSANSASISFLWKSDLLKSVYVEPGVAAFRLF